MDVDNRVRRVRGAGKGLLQERLRSIHPLPNLLLQIHEKSHPH